jgi:IS5 family transposase
LVCRISSDLTWTQHKLYALHAPEVECLAKGKARKPYEFGVKAAMVISRRAGLIMGARTFRNPYDGHILSAVIEQATNLIQDLPVRIKDRGRSRVPRRGRRQPRPGDHHRARSRE